MLFSDGTYKVLKQVALVWLPLFASLYFGLDTIWHLPAATEVVGTVTLIDTLLGGLLGLSTSQYNKNGQFDGKYDGEFVLQPTEDGTSVLRVNQLDMAALQTKDRVTFRVSNPDLPAPK